MSQDKRGLFSHIFITMMIFCGLVWVWTVALILAWPWEKSTAWKPEFRLAAVCKDGACSIPYGGLADARAKGTLASLVPTADAGEIGLEDAWLKWKKVAGQPWQIESTASSWHFQTTVRYRLEGDTPVLVEYQEVGGKAFYYGMGLAALSLLGIFLRKLRG